MPESDLFLVGEEGPELVLPPHAFRRLSHEMFLDPEAPLKRDDED